MLLARLLRLLIGIGLKNHGLGAGYLGHLHPIPRTDSHIFVGKF